MCKAGQLHTNIVQFDHELVLRAGAWVLSLLELEISQAGLDRSSEK